MAKTTKLLGKRKAIDAVSKNAGTRVAKRKLQKVERESKIGDDGDDEDEDDALRAALQRHFEAQFDPLPEETTKRGDEVEDGMDTDDADSGLDVDLDCLSDASDAGLDGDQDGSDEDDSFSGFDDETADGVDSDSDSDYGSDSDGEPEIEEVVVTVGGGDRPLGMDKREMRAFMSSKPPSLVSAASKRQAQTSKKSGADGDEDEADNIVNDAALQRLLRESNLLSEQSLASNTSVAATTTATSSSSLADRTVLTGRNRHKALDLHAMTLGAKLPALREKNIPMSKRKGMLKKAVERETKRRQEALETGVVLEKVDKKSASWLTAAQKGTAGAGGKKRTRGVAGPGIGKMKGATLTLSNRDIKGIERAEGGFGGGRGGGRGGRGGSRGKGRGGRGGGSRGRGRN